MQILLNDKNEIISYAKIGGISGGITVEIPDSVLNDNPLSYLYQNWQFVKNPDYKPPTETVKTVDEQINEIQAKIDELNLSVDLLVMNAL